MKDSSRKRALNWSWQQTKKMEKVTLTVLEAYTRDVGRGIVRIDYSTMWLLDVTAGDIIEIRSKKRTVAKCFPLYPSDEEKNIVRMDLLLRDNAGTKIGNNVTLEKIDAT